MRHDWYSLVIIAGILLLIPALANIADNKSLLANGHKTLATVTDIAAGKDSEGNHTYTFTCSFLQANGDSAHIIHQVHAEQPEYTYGQKLPVIYDVQKPSSGQLLQYRMFYTALICLCIALPLLVLGAGYYITWWLMGRKHDHYWL